MMAKKTLIINGSPRKNGNTVELLRVLKEHLDGEIVELSAFYSNIAPCVDCRGCWETAQCVVHDEMQVIYDDDFDNLVVASPVYYGTMPGQMLSLMSRLQPGHAAQNFLKKPLVKRPKKAALILTAGSKGNQERAFHHVGALCRQLNASGFREHYACSPLTDTIPASQDEQAKKDVVKIAQWLMEE